MATLNNFVPVNDVDDVDASWVGNLIASSMRSEYKNIETLSADKTLTNADTPTQLLDCNGANRIVKMPTGDAVDNHLFWVGNNTASGNYTLTIQNNAGTVNLCVLLPGEFALFQPDGSGGYKVVNRQFSVVLTPAQITANQNDYNPTGASNANVIRASTDASRDITGVAFIAPGEMKLWKNVGSFNQVFKHESASSVAENRFALVDSADLTVKPNMAILLWNDPTSQRINVIGGNRKAKQMLIANAFSSSVPASSSYYITPGSSMNLQINSYNCEFTEPCTLSNLRVFIASSQPASGTLVVTVQKNNIDTPLTVTMPANGAAQLLTDTTNSVDFSQGDLCIIKFANNATSTSAQVTRVSLSITFD